MEQCESVSEREYLSTSSLLASLQYFFSVVAGISLRCSGNCVKLDSSLKGFGEGFIPVCVTPSAGSGIQKGECSLKILLQPSLGCKIFMKV